MIGNGTNQTIIASPAFRNGITINADHCNISGFYLTCGSKLTLTSGIHISSEHNNIDNCTFFSNYIGITVTHDYNTISYCKFDFNYHTGIRLAAANTTKILNCTTEANNYGISLAHTKDSSIIASEFDQNGVGIKIHYDSIGNYIFDNIVLNSQFEGMLIDNNSYYNSIINNTFKNNDGWGVKIEGHNNSIFYNNFMNNSNGGTQANDGGTDNHWNTSIKGNYWNDWTSPDTNSDGIVDKPYVISGSAGAKDYYPLVEPVSGIPTPPNEPPKIVTSNLETIYVGQQYSVNYTATDSDTPLQNLTWTMKTNATWLTFSSKQELSGTPSESEIGTYWVNISVSDGENIDSTNFTLTVLNQLSPQPQPGNGSVIIVRTGQRFTKIQDAINNASSGDTIRVWEGIYNERIEIHTSIDLIGNGSDVTTIKGPQQWNTTDVVADNCSITGFSIFGSGTSYWSAGISLYWVNNCKISNCNLSRNRNGIRITDSNSNLISNNTFYKNYHYGIWINSLIYSYPSLYNTINNNIFIENRNYGVYIDSNCKNNLIYRNNFIGNMWAVNCTCHQGKDNGVNNKWNSSIEGNFWSEWTSPDNNSDGIVDFLYMIDGSAGAKDWYPLAKTTIPIDYSPVIISTNVNIAYVSKLYSVNYTATDPDTPVSSLIWTMKTNASWLNFSSTQGLYGTPSTSDIGNYWVYIAVSDGENSDSTNFTLKVMDNKPKPDEKIPIIKNTNLEDNSQNVSVNTSIIIIEFSKPMNRTSVEAVLKISPNLNYTLVWENNNTVLKIIFSENLSYNTKYTITIDSSAKAYDGTGLDKPFELVFTTERSKSKDDLPSTDDGEWGMVMILAIVSVISLILIFLIILSFITKSRRKYHEETARVRYEHEPEGINVTNGLDEEIYELKKSALAPEKPSDFGISKQEMINKFKKKYQKGGISRETYTMIKESLKDK